MKILASGRALALAAGASLLFASSMAFAQETAPGADDAPEQEMLFPPHEPAAPEQTALPEFAQIIPPICFDAAGEFSINLNPAVCGVFEGAPGTAGGVGPTGTILQTDPAPGVAMEPAAPAPDFAAAPPPADEEFMMEDEGFMMEDEEFMMEEGVQSPPPPPQAGY